MGLDMYLSVRKYVSQTDWSRMGEYRDGGYDQAPENPEYGQLVKMMDLDGMLNQAGHSGAYVSATAIYWRKANAIHQWFVDNCAEGVDDCRPVWVGQEKLEELYNLVCEVLAHRTIEKAKELLPPQAGFFFGATEIEEWYWEDLEYTRDSLGDLLEVYKKKSMVDGRDVSIDFEYQASW